MLAVALLASTLAALPVATDAADPMVHLEVLAADAMEGRGLGQPGLDRAIDYAVSVFESLELEPLFTDADGNPSWTQELAVDCYEPGAGSQLRMTSRSGTEVLGHGDRMLVVRPGMHASIPPAEVVFVGYGIHEPDHGIDDYAGLDVRGKWAVLAEGAPADLPPELAEFYGTSGEGGDRLIAALEKAGVVGAIIFPEEGLYSAWDYVVREYGARVYVASEAYARGSNADTPFPTVILDEAGIFELFGVSTAEELEAMRDTDPRPLDGLELSLDVEARHSRITTRNVGARLRGSTRPDESVHLTAHIDHLGIVDGVIHNGANDDASGSAVVLAAAARMSRLERSVDFVLFTGEETGHFGSLHLLKHSPDGVIVGGLNLEHVGRAADGTFLTTVSPELFPDFAGWSADGMRVVELADPRIVRGSDSYSYHLNRIPFAIMGGGGFDGYHSPDDDIEFIDPHLLSSAVDLSLKFVGRLAGIE